MHTGRRLGARFMRLAYVIFATSRSLSPSIHVQFSSGDVLSASLTHAKWETRQQQRLSERAGTRSGKMAADRDTHRFDSSAGISNDGYVLFSGEIDLMELEKNIRAWSTRLSIWNEWSYSNWLYFERGKRILIAWFNYETVFMRPKWNFIDGERG